MNSTHSNAAIARCRELASECLLLIPAVEEKQKRVLLEMAEYWTTLADKIKRGEKVDGEISLAPIIEQLKGSLVRGHRMEDEAELVRPRHQGSYRPP
jgi:hypothetical protein